MPHVVQKIEEKKRFHGAPACICPKNAKNPNFSKHNCLKLILTSKLMWIKFHTALFPNTRDNKKYNSPYYYSLGLFKLTF